MGLFKTAAKVAVASRVHGNVQRRQHQRFAAQDAASAATATAAQPVPAAPAPVAAAPAQVPAAAVAAPAAPGGTDAMLSQLVTLGELRAAGVLTEGEFENQKARILAQ